MTALFLFWKKALRFEKKLSVLEAAFKNEMRSRKLQRLVENLSLGKCYTGSKESLIKRFKGGKSYEQESLQSI